MKWLLKFILLTLIHISAFGQTPEKMSYQAVIRENSGSLLENSNVSLKIVLRQGTPQGPNVYSESHYTSTNRNGLLSLEIGSGTVEKGRFNEIDWAKGPYFIETHVDPKGNSNYKVNGVSQMLSVPYALHAKSADSFVGTISPSQLPDFYTAEEVDNLILDIITKEVNTSNFSGNYKDLVDKPVLFSGVFNDLKNKPELYDKAEIDRIIQSLEITGGSPQNLLIDGNTLSISGGNSVSFENWDTNAADDFSGDYDDLENKPEIYTKNEINDLFQNIGTTGGSPQNLSLDGKILSISGGNSISFEAWDMGTSGNFDGKFESLTGVPELYNKKEIEDLISAITLPELFSKDFNDLINVPELYTKTQVDSLMVNNAVEGTVQSLTLNGQTLSITGGNSISFEGWDMDASDDFDGKFESLTGVPELYNKKEVEDLISAIEVGEASPQQLSLAGNTLSISGGNTISFEGWDMDASDDFSGNYEDLINRPELFSKDFKDLINVPELYNKKEVEDLISAIEVGGALPQQLSLAGNTLSISEGNTISFAGWDMDATDDFDGKYSSLTGVPELYNKKEVDNLINAIEVGEAAPQQLNLVGNTLSISGGNTISFAGWDMDASNDFDGKYSSLVGAPKIYTQEEVDKIKVEILKQVEANYSKKATIVSFSSSRNINTNDIGNTVACTSSATLTIVSGFSGMQVGDVINLEVHGTTLTVKGAADVIINGKSGGTIGIGNNSAYTGGIIRKLANNSYIVL